MQACEEHEDSAQLTKEAAEFYARWMIALFEDAPAGFAEGMNDLDRPPCCPRAGYARSLMKAAFRELLQGEAADYAQACGECPVGGPHVGTCMWVPLNSDLPDHDLMMPHEVHFLDDGDYMIQGCPPNCPRRLAVEA